MTRLSLRQRLTFGLLPLAIVSDKAVAAVYGGGGLEAGVGAASLIPGTSHMSLRGAILNILYKVLSFLALAAVFMIVMAGFYLVISNGSDEIKGKVKNIVIYVIVGLIIVLFARAIVGFITQGVFYG